MRLPKFLRRDSDVHIVYRVNGAETLSLTGRDLALIARYSGRDGVIDLLEGGLIGDVRSIEFLAEHLPSGGKHDPCRIKDRLGSG